MNPDRLNGSNLAYIGDAYYELIVRERLLSRGITKSKELNKEKVKYVSAKSHNIIYQTIEDKLTLEEKDIFKRGRNHKYHTRKNSSINDYLNSSGFEAVVGYLFLSEKKERLNEIITLAFKVVEGDSNE